MAASFDPRRNVRSIQEEGQAQDCIDIEPVSLEFEPRYQNADIEHWIDARPLWTWCFTTANNSQQNIAGMHS
jgi:hypothetical protein